MKIYTKKGDKGKSQLFGGSIVNKDNVRLECYGTIDELNAFIGNIYDQSINKNHKSILKNIQNQLFTIGAEISSDKKNNIYLPEFSEKNVTILEKEIDKMDEKLPPLTSFILPSGHDISSRCHIARTICRRAERRLVTLSSTSEINTLHIKYLNRLSDYLFTLARDILLAKNKKEIKWEKEQ